jgi:hypothetical protein
MSKTLEEELQTIAQRVAHSEPLAYVYGGTVYIIWSMEINETEVLLTFFCSDESISPRIDRGDTAALQAFVTHVKEFNG